MKEYKYVVQRRYQTKLAKRVGSALGKMFEAIDLFINGRKSLHDQPKAVEQMKSILKDLEK